MDGCLASQTKTRMECVRVEGASVEGTGRGRDRAVPLAWVVRLGGEPVPEVKTPAASVSSELRGVWHPCGGMGASGLDAEALKHCPDSSLLV